MQLIKEATPSFKSLRDEFENSSLQNDGRYQPSECRARHLVAIVVPYRDRFEHLNIFLRNIHPFLQKQQLDYTIFIVEQAGNFWNHFPSGWQKFTQKYMFQAIVRSIVVC